MPYASNDQLPAAVRSHLPPAAQDIFRKTFNRAFERYGEITAFRIAWTAVKRRYGKVGDCWVRRWPGMLPG